MDPKIVLTKQGEKLITAIAEFTDPETQKGLGFVFRCPYVLSMSPNGDGQFSVNFTKWIPYSTDVQYKVPYDVVAAVGEPEPDILNVYLEKFGDKLNDSNTIPTTDSSDSSEGSGLSDSSD